MKIQLLAMFFLETLREKKLFLVLSTSRHHAAHDHMTLTSASSLSSLTLTPSTPFSKGPLKDVE